MAEFQSAAPPRFFIESPLAPGADVELSERATRHAAVLRLRMGDRIDLFNGEGGEFECTLSRLGRNSMRARVVAWRDVDRESGINVTLAQGLSSGDRMDYTVQKATELGVRAIQPLTTERSVVRLNDERADRRLAHWRNIVAAACEQCGRNRLPELHPVATLGAFVANAETDAVRLLLAPTGSVRLRDLPRAEKIILLVGPEGGFSEDEEHRAQRAGFAPVCIGPRVLRTETAPLAAIAALQSMWGDG
jgi:16S rRNA (uracil1498-N3)-methyltransferase